MDKTFRKPTLCEAIIPIAALMIFLMVGVIVYELDPQIPIVLGIMVAAVFCMRMGYSWKDVEDSMIAGITSALQPILILMVVGILIGTWIQSGVVPTIIYYGLKIISPRAFLLVACVMCCIVSLATGSSWGTAGTVGIALLGIGSGLGIPAPMTAGAIISGAYFGDKMSPLSDTTNLAPAMAGDTLFEHIRHMMYTTSVSLIIALVGYAILGMRFTGTSLNAGQLKVITQALSQNFNINLLLLIPPVVVILMVALKVPALPGLMCGAVLGGVFAAIFQGSSFGDILSAAHYGYESATGVEMVDSLLSNGGLDKMMWTVSLMLCALAFGGIMDKGGFLEKIAGEILKFVKSDGDLILATVISSILTNIVTAEQYMSIVIPGKMYKDAYKKRALHPKNLSRTLEDAGTLSAPLVPWSTCGAYLYTTLGVSPIAYLPFTFFNLINPIIAVIYGYTGFTIEKLPKEETADTGGMEEA
mgnify:CR=1 FL=1|jgi:NhaC family Na+:H+ antiporter